LTHEPLLPRYNPDWHPFGSSCTLLNVCLICREDSRLSESLDIFGQRTEALRRAMQASDPSAGSLETPIDTFQRDSKRLPYSDLSSWQPPSTPVLQPSAAFELPRTPDHSPLVWETDNLGVTSGWKAGNAAMGVWKLHEKLQPLDGMSTPDFQSGSRLFNASNQPEASLSQPASLQTQSSGMGRPAQPILSWPLHTGAITRNKVPQAGQGTRPTPSKARQSRKIQPGKQCVVESEGGGGI
jgi:hypothetical protein